MTVVVLSAALLAGLIAGLITSPDARGMVLVALASGLGCAVGWRLRPARWLGALVLATALGALRPGLGPGGGNGALAAFEGERVELLGRVAGASERRGQSAFVELEVFELRRATSGEAFHPEPSPELPRVELRGQSEGSLGQLGSGDWAVAEGRLAPLPSVSSAHWAEAARRRGLTQVVSFPRVELLDRAPRRADPRALAADLREAVRTGIADHLPEPQSALSFGMLLGGTTTLEGSFRRQFQAAGLGHLVAVSGYNVVVVSALAGWVAVRLVGRRGALLPVLGALAGYTLLVGAPPSAVRAAIMGGAAALALSIGRIADPLTSVLLAAVAMSLLDPTILLDLGFQLSLAATLGLILLYPWLQAWLRRVRIPRLVADPLALALAAELATLPLVLSVFHRVSIVAPVANVLAAPLVPMSMLGSALLAVSLPLPPLASLTAWLAWLPTTLLVEVARIAGSLPFATFSTGALPPAGAALLAGALLVFGFATLPEPRFALRRAIEPSAAELGLEPRWLAVAVSTAGTVLVVGGLVAATRPDGLLHLTVLSAPARGQTVLVRGPSGQTVLVSGAEENPADLASSLVSHLALWERSLGAVVILDQRHEHGLSEALRRYPPAVLVRAADGPVRLELGDGAILDVETGEARVEVGAVRVALPRDLGIPPAGGTMELVSDGVELWPT